MDNFGLDRSDKLARNLGLDRLFKDKITFIGLTPVVWK